tara:strand:+ start:18393 stop:18908 length:516 start_codon:yes stop_codon:yes gene_type:complete
MKKALIGYQGWVQDIREPGEEFEIYNGPDASIQWVDAPDEITLDWTLEWSPQQQQMIWVERDGPYTQDSEARRVAYGEVGEQLDMIFHEIQESGSISASGPWASHISTVKSMIPAPAAPELITEEEAMVRRNTTEPSENKPCNSSTSDLPAWKRYSGWTDKSNDPVPGINQ